MGHRLTESYFTLGEVEPRAAVALAATSPDRNSAWTCFETVRVCSSDAPFFTHRSVPPRAD